MNSDDHYIYYCGQESLKRNGATLISQYKSPEYSAWVQSQKSQNDLCLFPRQTIQHHRNPKLCPTTDAEEAEADQFFKDLQDLLELAPRKDVLFIIVDWKAQVGSQ